MKSTPDNQRKLSVHDGAILRSCAPRRRSIAVCGKGGVGKTALAVLIGRALVESGRAGRLLLIDADPAMGLSMALGASIRKTIGQVREDIIRTAQIGEGQTTKKLASNLDYMTFEALCEMDLFALLAMGRMETLGCYCPVNDLLRGAIEALSKSFDTILIDGEAGLEQLNRRVMRRTDDLLVISDPTSRGLQTAALIKHMVEIDRVIECARIGLVFNRVQGNCELLEQSAREIGMQVLGFIPQDESIAQHDLIGKPLTDLPKNAAALVAVRALVERLILAESTS